MTTVGDWGHLLEGEWPMSPLMLVLLIVVILLLLGGGWSYRTGYYGPGQFGGVVGAVLLVVLILWLVGALR